MKTAFIAIAAAAAALAAPATAGSIIVQHGDLNLTTAAGQKTLDGRIDVAARKVCGVADARAAGPLRAVKALRCVAKAKASAAESFAMAISQDKKNS